MSERDHKRFWAAMLERYGSRWAAQYGPNATQEWQDLIDRYEPAEVKAALAGLSKASPEFPPTLPQVEALLAKAAQAAKGYEVNYRRGYWRTLIVAEMADLLGHTFGSLEHVIVAHKATLGAAMLNLLNDSEQAEVSAGERTWAMERECQRRCGEIAKGYPELRRDRAA